MKIGSLFSGYGGIDLGVQSVLGGTVAWHCENDKAPAKVLAHRWPDVPNLGDITAVDWPAVEPVDVITGGFPCQPVSCAGKRVGTSDARWLFDEIVRAIGGMGTQPGLCVFENVPGLLTANHGDAMARVVHGLASVGYVGCWRVVRAADVGAPHGRARVFIIARPAADTDHIGSHGSWLHGSSKRWGSEPADGSIDTADTNSGPLRQQPVPEFGRGGAAIVGLAGADVTADSEPAGVVGGPDAAECGAVVADADDTTANREWPCTEPWQGSAVVADADGIGNRRTVEGVNGQAAQTGAASVPVRATRPAASADWNQYGPAIHRWERVLGRLAPPPTEPGSKGQPRLSPRFVQWLMGLPEGWVTDVPGVSRNDQLKCLGNGVVPQQCALALRLLLPLEVAA